MELLNIPYYIYMIFVLIICVIVFALFGIWELFDKHVLGTEYESRNKHYRSF